MQEIKNISAYKHSLKSKILTTAMTAFGEEGIRAVKMDDIAARLGISKRTLYEIYDNKEDLLFEGVKAYHEQQRKKMREFDSRSRDVLDTLLFAYWQKVEEFRRTSPTFYSDLSKYPHVLRYFEEVKEQNRDGMRNFYQKGVREGYFRSDLDYELAGSIFEALGCYIMDMQLYKRYSMEELFTNLIFVSVRGMCTHKGIETLSGYLEEAKNLEMRNEK